MNFINKEIESYITAHNSGETEILKKVVRESEKELDHIDMLSGSQVGLLLKLLVRIGGYRRILEVGTFTGYSAIWMADALPDDGELVTLEMNERYQSLSDQFFSKEPYRSKIRQIMGPALESVESLEGEFGLIYIDADKVQYPDYFRCLKPKLKKGGTIVIDNVLWSGDVLSPGDIKSRNIDSLNKIIRDDADFDNIILPVRDGIMAAVKIS